MKGVYGVKLGVQYQVQFHVLPPHLALEVGGVLVEQNALCVRRE